MLCNVWCCSIFNNFLYWIIKFFCYYRCVLGFKISFTLILKFTHIEWIMQYFFNGFLCAVAFAYCKPISYKLFSKAVECKATSWIQFKGFDNKRGFFFINNNFAFFLTGSLVQISSWGFARKKPSSAASTMPFVTSFDKLRRYKEETAENIIKIKISWDVEYLFSTILSFTKCTLQSVLVKIFLIVAASSSFLSNLSFLSHKRWQAFFAFL